MRFARLRLLDAAVRGTASVARMTQAVVTTALYLPSWRPTDLYAAAQMARLHVEHGLIDQAGDALDDEDQEVTLVAGRTWPWLGGAYVYQEQEDVK